MDSVYLEVYFEAPFWVGIYQRHENGWLTASRTVFGAEPSDAEIYAWICAAWHKLRFSPPVKADLPDFEPHNPKQQQRAIRHMLTQRPRMTKAQQALQAGRELAAQTRKSAKKERLQAEKERKFQLRQQKKKQKHRGG